MAADEMKASIRLQLEDAVSGPLKALQAQLAAMQGQLGGMQAPTLGRVTQGAASAGAAVRVLSNEFVDHAGKVHAASEAIGRHQVANMKAAGSATNLSGALIAVAAAAAGIGLAVKRGIDFNKTMEESRTGLGALILSTHSFKTSTGEMATAQDSLNESFRMSEQVQKDLWKASLSTASTYQQLVQAFQSAYGPATSVGITNISKLEKVVVSGSQAVAALGLDSRQTAQELRALFTGEQSPDNTLTRVLRITKEEIDKARRAGEDMSDWFLKKLAPYSVAAAAATENFSVRLSNLTQTIDMLLGAATKPIFDTLKAGMSGSTDLLERMKGSLVGVGESIATAMQTLAPLGPAILEVFLQGTKALMEFASALGPLVPSLVTILGALAKMIDVLGPMGPAIFVGVKAFGLMSGALGSLFTVTGTVTTAQMALYTVTKLVGIEMVATAGAIGLIGAALAGAVVTIYGAIKAWQYWRETQKEEESNVGTKDATIKLLDTLQLHSGKYWQEIQDLKKKLFAVSPEDTAALAKLNDKAMEFRRLINPVKYVPEVIASANPVLDAETKKKIDETRKAYEHLVADLEAKRDLAGLTGLDRVLGDIVKKAQDAKREITSQFTDEKGGLKPGMTKADLARAYGLVDAEQVQESERALKDWQEKRSVLHLAAVKEMDAFEGQIAALRELGLAREIGQIDRELQAQKDGFAKQKEELGKAGNWTAQAKLDLGNLEAGAIALAGSKRADAERKAWDGWRSVALKEAESALADEGKVVEAGLLGVGETYRKMREDLDADMKGATMSGNTGLAAYLQTLIDKLPELKKAAEKRLATTVFEQMSAQLTKLQGDLKRGVVTVQEYWAGVAPILYRGAETAQQGIAAGWAGILGDLKTTGQATADLLRGVWDTIGKGFEDSVYNVISGKAKNLGDVLKGVWDDILRGFSQFITKMVQAAILGDQRSGQTGMFAGLFGAGDGTSGASAGGVPTSSDWATKMGAPSSSGSINWGGALAGGLAGAAAGYSISGNGTGAAIGAVTGIVAAALAMVNPLIGALVAAFGMALAAFAKDSTEVIEYIMGTAVIARYQTIPNPNGTGSGTPPGSGPDGVSPPGSGGRWGRGRDNSGWFRGDPWGFGAGAGAAGPPPGWSPADWASQWSTGTRHGVDFTASLGSTRNRLVELLRGSGLEADLAKGLSEAITKILTEMNVKVFAGSSQDLAANWKDLVQKWGPEWLIKTAFGFTPSGDDKLLGGIEGVPGFSQFDAKKATGPITEMMKALGFTTQGIQTIADQIDLRDLDKWMEWFSNIISIVRKGKELSGLLGGSVADEAAKRAGTSGLDTVLASGKDLVASFSGLDLLTGDERVTKTKELLDLAEQQYEAGLAYYTKVKALFDQLQAGIDKLVLDTRDWSAGKGADWLLQDTRLAAANNRQWFLSEADPEKAAQYAKAAIEAAALVLQGLRAMYEQAKTLKAEVDDLIEGFSDPSKGINPAAGLQAYLNQALALVSSIAKAAGLSGQAQLDAIANIKASAQDLYRTQQQLLQAVADQAKALKAGVAETRWQLDYGDMDPQQQSKALKDRIQSLMDQLNSSTDPTEIGNLQSQIRQFLTQYYGLFSKDDPNRAAAHQWVDEVLTILEKTGVGALDGIKATVESWSSIIAEGLKKVSTDLGAQMTALKAEIETWTKWLGELRGEIDTKLKGVATALEVANAALKTQVDLATAYFLNLNAPEALPQTRASIDQTNAAFDRSTLSVNAFKDALDKATLALGGQAPAAAGATTDRTLGARQQTVQDVITVLRRNPSILRGTA